MTEQLLVHGDINSVLHMEVTERLHIWPTFSKLKKNSQVLR